GVTIVVREMRAGRVERRVARQEPARADVGHQRAIDGRLAANTVGAISETLRSSMIGVAIAACVGFADGAAAASEQRLTYTVQMSPYGTIGTYHSAKQKNGHETTIT